MATPPKYSSTHPLNPTTKWVYKVIKWVMVQIVQWATRTIASLDADKISPEDMADIAFICRESDELIKEIRARLKLVGERAQYKAGWFKVQTVDIEPIVTMTVKAYPKGKPQATVPTFERMPKEYNQLMDWLGVSEELRDRGKVLTEDGLVDTEVLSINWVSFQNLVAFYAQQGYGNPPGISDKMIKYTVKLGMWKTKNPILLPEDEPSLSE